MLFRSDITFRGGLLGTTIISINTPLLCITEGKITVRNTPRCTRILTNYSIRGIVWTEIIILLFIEAVLFAFYITSQELGFLFLILFGPLFHAALFSLVTAKRIRLFNSLLLSAINKSNQQTTLKEKSLDKSAE